MLSLFPIEEILPQGFKYKEDFLSTDEEERLIKAVSRLSLHPLIFQGFEAKRKVASYGYDYNFDKRSVSKGQPIPHDLEWLLHKVAIETSIPSPDFGEVLVTEYPPGSVINWHRDAPPFDVIAGISLLSDCIFKLRPYEKSKQNRKAIKSLTVKRRSFYLMEGDARSEWEHSIAPVKEIRYSITLRTLRK